MSEIERLAHELVWFVGWLAGVVGWAGERGNEANEV